MKLSKVGIAVQFLNGQVIRFCSGSQPPRGIKPEEQGFEEGWLRRVYKAKVMPPDYAGIYTDWEPWRGKDAVTALGDLLRNLDQTSLIARLAG